MKRLLRILRHTITLLSLLLCLATATLWIRSLYYLDELDLYRPGTHWSIWSLHGRILIHRHQWIGPAPRWRHPIELHSTDLDLKEFGFRHIPFTWKKAGFAYGSLTSGFASMSLIGHVYMLPHWPLIALFGLLPAIAASRWTVRRCFARARSSRGLCPNCGYDLRSTPTRCPECGHTSPVLL